MKTERSTLLHKILAGCGIVSSVLFIVTDVVASATWKEYSYVNQAFSELTAVEAPTRPLMIAAVGIPYNVLVVAFSAGVWMNAGMAGKRNPMKVAAIMILLHAVSGFLGGSVFPMHSRGISAGIATDQMHIIFTAAEVVTMLLAIVFAAASFGKKFRVFSIFIFVLLVVGGGLAAMYGSAVGANKLTPGLGIVERVNVYAFMLWTAILSVMLVRPSRLKSVALHTGTDT